jgi:hypothetical protein
VGVGLLGRAVVGQGFRLLATWFWSRSPNCRPRSASLFVGLLIAFFPFSAWLHGGPAILVVAIRTGSSLSVILLHVFGSSFVLSFVRVAIATVLRHRGVALNKVMKGGVKVKGMLLTAAEKRVVDGEPEVA